jgi:tryptophan synthase alpha chain
LVRRVRRYTALPVAVGFGIGSREQVKDVLRYADAAVVGSAIVKVIEESQGPDLTVGAVESFVSDLLGIQEADNFDGRVFAT